MYRFNKYCNLRFYVSREHGNMHTAKLCRCSADCKLSLIVRLACEQRGVGVLAIVPAAYQHAAYCVHKQHITRRHQYACPRTPSSSLLHSCLYLCAPLRPQQGIGNMPLAYAVHAPKATVDPHVYIPPPLNTKAMGW